MLGALRKEVHFFDLNFRKGPRWYRQFFPTLLYKRRNEKKYKQPLQVGEASPYYLYHPLVAKRVQQVLPDAKIFVLLRNPIDRAYSHYQHLLRRGLETCSFEKALRLEDMRLEGETVKIINHLDYLSPSQSKIRKHSAKARKKVRTIPKYEHGMK